MSMVLNALPVIKTEIEESTQVISAEATQVEREIEVASGGMPLWAIALIVTVIVLILLMAVSFSAFFVFHKKKKSAKNDYAKSKSNDAKKKSSENQGMQPLGDLKDKKSIPVPDRNGAIYPEVVLINLSKPECVYRTRIIDKVMIGRSEGSDIRISDDATVSAEQCVVFVKGTQFYLNDCNSTNGTYYNDKEVTELVPIMSGGILEVGHGKYRLMIGKYAN